MSNEWLPWEEYSDLALERLVAVAEILMRARDGAADDHLPDTGETTWSLGVSAFERSNKAICDASQRLGWLTIVHGENGGPVHFIFRIGLYPVRFYHGAPGDLPDRYSAPSEIEADALQLPLALEGGMPPGRFFRIAVETDFFNRTARVLLIECDQDIRAGVKQFTIPIATLSTMAPTPGVTPILTAKPGVELPKPSVEIIAPARKNTNDV